MSKQHIMTFERAIEILNPDGDWRGNSINNLEEVQKACRIAIIAMKKQIKNTPDYEGDGYDDNGNIILDTWYCPNCRKAYEVDYDEYSYCPHCGQKIDLEGIV